MQTLSLAGAGAVFLGGGTGSVLRWLLASASTAFFHKLWAGTLVVNILGSALMFVFLRCFQDTDRNLQLLLTVGFLGGFTTFSAFSYEMVTLLRQGQYAELFLMTCLNIFPGILVGIGVLR